MDKPTFASVYSTAAILAAFSQASASADEAACGIVPMTTRTGPSALEACAGVMRRCLTGRSRPSDPIVAQGSAIASVMCPRAEIRRALSARPQQTSCPTQPRVTSHFAFGEEARIQAGPGASSVLDP